MSHNGKRRNPSWEEIGEAGKIYGWFPESIEKKKVVFERGRQKIIAKRIPKTSKWKVEYFSGEIMDDTTGSETENFAKKLATEMLLLK